VARRSFAGRLLRWILLLCVLGIAGWIVWEAATWPDVAGLARRPPTTTAFIERYKERERVAGRRPQVAIVWTPYSAISPNVKRAVLVAEDINFFSHHGFDRGEIRSALEESLGERERRAAPPPSASSSSRTSGSPRVGARCERPRRRC